jgi:tetratricopeptide (TPR) repeat protein
MAGRYQLSVDAYRRGLSAEPGSIEGLSGLAQTFMRLGKTEEAKRLLMQVIAANPRRPVDLAMAGELFVQSGDLQRGVDLLQHAEAMRPSAHTEVLLATAFMKMKQPQRAKELLDRARVRGGNSADVFRAVANYYREQRDYNAAVETLNQIPNKTPDLLAEIGYTYAVAGDKRAAAKTYIKAADRAPADLKIQLSAAESLARLQDAEGARKYLARAESLNANYYRLHAIRADLARNEPASDVVDEVRSHASTIADGARCYLATQHQVVVTSLLDRFGTDVRAHVDGTAEATDPTLIAELVAIADGQATVDERHARKQPDWSYDEIDSGQSPADRRDELVE